MNADWRALTLENERRLYAAFLLHGITEVSVDFDGSGDSGQIDYVGMRQGSEEYRGDAQVCIWDVSPAREFNPETKTWEAPPPVEQPVFLKAAIRAVVYEHLEHCGIDWYNNDGGEGHWTWSAKDGVDFAVSYRTVEVHLGHHETRPLGCEDESAVEDQP